MRLLPSYLWELVIVNNNRNPEREAKVLSILNPGTLGRIETNEYRAEPGSKPLNVLEAIKTVNNAVWSDLTATPQSAPRPIPPLRRRLQRSYVDALFTLAKTSDDGEMGDAGAFSLAELRSLAAQLAAAERRAYDPTSAAHLSETSIRITRFLHAQFVVG